ncbi:MAG: hypothetical protein COV72_04255 [Candidatus Omnitrophica bacterium CG11_big_fil_rev_8_21_14_0_20_42_13]|uniref:Amidohydrolase-related domain-containing protein n=1 Tax=Candidatus Ghiorseimicrobium undicola TaxID=1974746 RepID=A0A2H0LXS4_9BACT|nr:MAG: hypothetical protein COV72_04255 [Candidatus Omnitrophica bacterium CG11_big_fil_rev_8_21_14_0_20_42_13]
MIIDSHSHWLPQKIIDNSSFFSKTWGDIERHLELMEKYGIDKAVLSYPTTDAHLKIGSISLTTDHYNSAIAKIIKRYPEKFIGAAILPYDDKNELINELRRATEELGFKAISLASSYNGMYLDDKIFLPVYEYARKNNIPIFVHSQIVNPIGFERVKDPLLTPVIEYIFDITICIGKLLMSGVLREFGEVKFIFAYFGGTACHLSDRFNATYQMLRGINFVKDLGANPSDILKNIYVDTSGDSKHTNLLAALKLVGPGHILWGSDWPAKKDIAPSIKAINDLNITQEEKEGILGKNLLSLL